MNTTLRFMGKFENIVRAVTGSRGFERGRARVLSAAPQWLMHQAAWWFCVLGPEGWGLLPMVAFLWTHLASNRSRLLTESTLVTAAVLIGFSVAVIGCAMSAGLFYTFSDFVIEDSILSFSD